MNEPELIIFEMGQILIRVVRSVLVSSIKKNVNRLDCLERSKKNDSKQQK